MTESTEKKSPPVYESPWYGRVSAVVWAQEGQHGPMYNLSLREHFKSADDGWKSTRSIPEDQIGNLAPAATDAHRWIAQTRQDGVEKRHAAPAGA